MPNIREMRKEVRHLRFVAFLGVSKDFSISLSVKNSKKKLLGNVFGLTKPLKAVIMGSNFGYISETLNIRNFQILEPD
jgi:hypothetical protein